MCRSNCRTAREVQGHGIAQSAVNQVALLFVADDSNRRKQPRNRGARSHNVAERRALIEARPEIARSAGADVVTRDAKTPHPVMQAIEAGRFQLAKPIG